MSIPLKKNQKVTASLCVTSIVCRPALKMVKRIIKCVLSLAVVIKIKGLFESLIKNNFQHHRLYRNYFKSTVVIVIVIIIAVLKLFASNTDDVPTNSEDTTSKYRPINVDELRRYITTR